MDFPSSSESDKRVSIYSSFQPDSVWMYVGVLGRQSIAVDKPKNTRRKSVVCLCGLWHVWVPVHPVLVGAMLCGLCAHVMSLSLIGRRSQHPASKVHRWGSNASNTIIPRWISPVSAHIYGHGNVATRPSFQVSGCGTLGSCGAACLPTYS